LESLDLFGANPTDMIFNPCVEIGMWPVDETTGESLVGRDVIFQLSIVLLIVDEEDFYERCKAAAIIGTLYKLVLLN
jgi:hypothetical protein